MRGHLATSGDVEEILALTPGGAIVGLPIIVLVEEGFDPLAELEVVLVLGLDELVDVDVALDSVLVEGVLEDLVVLNELVLVLRAPAHSLERKGVGVEAVHDSAIDSSRRTLLNLLHA